MRLLLLTATFLALTGTAHAASYAGQPVRQGGVTLPARVSGADIQLAIKGGFATRFWPGVNLGVTVPGHAPGELAPTRKDYDRWLDGMQRSGRPRRPRVHDPAPRFYEALAAHNRRHPKTPLYFIQGVWIPEEEFLATRERVRGHRRVRRGRSPTRWTSSTATRRSVRAGGTPAAVPDGRLALAARVVPGRRVGPRSRRGDRRGERRRAAVPGPVRQSTRARRRWRAGSRLELDHLATLEAQRGWSRPLTFTNWLTVDPLEHPDGAARQEDRSASTPKHLHATAAWPGGFFASYHAYPYYPDFLRLSSTTRTAQLDPYAGYLRQLRAAPRRAGGDGHRVRRADRPGRRAPRAARPRPGRPRRAEAGADRRAMLREIEQTGYTGALLFEWTDEWFKRTWNTQDIAQPVDRRPLWHNVLTNETQFGVIAVEPGKRDVVTLDGRTGEWGNARDQARRRVPVPAGAQPVHDRDRRPAHPGPGPARDRRARQARPVRAAERRGPDPERVRRRSAHRAVGLPSAHPQPPADDPDAARRSPPEFLDLGHAALGRQRRPAARRRAPAARPSSGSRGCCWASPTRRPARSTRPNRRASTFGRVSGITVDGRRYTWPTWNRVEWHERRKQGWPILKSAFARAAR